MPLTAYVYPKLQIVKDVVKQMFKKSRSRRPFDRRHCKRTQTLLKYGDPHLWHIQ